MEVLAYETVIGLRSSSCLCGSGLSGVATMMTRAIVIALAALLVFPDFGRIASAADDSGTFRGKWWNYYDRALAGEERKELNAAVKDLAKAISMRDRDQRMARTYGMHFIDYFPHREIGIAYFEMGDLNKAQAELELSMIQEESAKAAYYLNAVRRELLKKQDSGLPAPIISILTPSAESALSGLSVRVTGTATGAALVARLQINGIPVRFDLAKQEIRFDQEIPLGEDAEEIVVTSEDLLGKQSRQKVRVGIDREGPAITIATLTRVSGATGHRAKIVGEVEDRTGINRIMINGRELNFKGGRQVSLDMTVDVTSGEKAEIKAYDILGNETVAELDLEKELTAFSILPKPVLVAANGPGIFTSDHEPPGITLKDMADLPAVYVDRYQVDGEVFDGTRVDRVTVNGLDVIAGKGKKVFFSKVVKLSVGKNRMLVEAFDKSGNRSQAEFTIHRVIPAALQIGSRMSMSLLPFDGKAKSQDIARLADDFLMGSFVDQKRFMLIEREKLKQILLEQQLSLEKLADPAHSVRVGKLIAADAILATTVREDQKSLEVVSRVINTETAEVMAVKDVYTENKSPVALKEAMDGLAAKIAGGFPLAEGMVIGREKKEILSDIGSITKVRKDMGAIIYRKGKEIRHPVTGRSLGADTIKLGEGWFADVQREFSKVRLSKRVRLQEIAMKDLLITR
jgi:tetratricopeptide (TPR) repeat protein